MQTIQQQARLAGLLYLVLALSAPLGLIYAPSQLFVAGDPAETAARITANPALLRWAIASELFHQIVQVFLLLALYRLFRPVSDNLARQLVILGGLVSIPIVFVNVLNEVAALLITGGALSGFVEPPLADGLTYLFVELHNAGIHVVSAFWGLWLFPFGLLVIRSGFIPRVLGYLLFVAGIGYLGASFGLLLLPQFAAQITAVQGIVVLGELPILPWLLIWGARPRVQAA